MSTKKTNTFFFKNNKKYPHYERHQANSRNVCFDEFKKSFEKINKRELKPLERKCFKTGFNMGYKEARKRKLNKLP